MENNNNEKINEIIETSNNETVEVKEKKNAFKTIGGFFSNIGKFFKKHKSNKIKNQALFKRGGYSLAITALVLVALIAFNWLIGSLAGRFNLEFDMTSDQKNSISEENIEYLKNLEYEVNVTICYTEEEYADYMNYYAQKHYYATAEADYFTQTVNLIKKYPAYSENIVVEYVDPQSTEFTAITTSYSSYNISYGDIIVTSEASGKERVKVLNFDDIYVMSESSSSSYYASKSITANKLETALTSAIAYVTSSDSKKVAVLSGHSENNYTSAYTELLTTNNYDITEITDPIINEISDEYDAIIISAPSIDFIGSELDVIADFLDNDGKLGKGLIFFADAACPALPNFYSFLNQWGISVGEGILFETNSNNHIQGEPSTIGIYPTSLEDDDITANLTYAIANYNVPMNVCEASSTKRTATALMQTLDSTVVAPIGSASDWADYTDDDKKQFDSVIQSVESDYDSENNYITSYVMAFSSVEYVQSTWASYSDLCNQDITLACTDRAAHVGNTGMTFTSKVITNQSFASSVTDKSSGIVTAIFMFALPIITIIAGILIFIFRRDSR